jgi:dihydrofolate reductase
VRLFLHPIVLGSGARLFDGETDRLTLELAESHGYGSGVVSLTYRPTER